jgi:hypothetical protein
MMMVKRREQLSGYLEVDVREGGRKRIVYIYTGDACASSYDSTITVVYGTIRMIPI